MKLTDTVKLCPRGAQPNTCLSHKGREYVVYATQVWETATGPKAMGLVLRGVCRVCSSEFYQHTPTHPTDVKDLCGFCGSEPFDGHDHIATRTVPQAGVKRRGVVEARVLEVAATFQRTGPVTLEELVERTVATMDAPEYGKRDTRRQVVERAARNLAREKDGPLAIMNGRMVFTG